MAYVRDNAAYSLQTIPVGGTVNATHLNEAAKWANAAHQRGICHTITGTRGRQHFTPALGYSSIPGQVIGPKLPIAMQLSIPEAYDRYTIHATMRMPRILADFSYPAKTFLSLGFTNSSGVFYPIFENLTGTSGNDFVQIYSGKIPVLGQIGALQRLWLVASVEVVSDDPNVSATGKICAYGVNSAPAYAGFHSITCMIHKDNEC